MNHIGQPEGLILNSLGQRLVRALPIFHFTRRSIEAHLMICYLAYALSRYIQRQIAQFNEKMSVQRIKDELKQVSSNLLESDEGKLFKMPCHMSEDALKIYRAFGMGRKRHPEQVISNGKCNVSKKIQTF